MISDRLAKLQAKLDSSPNISAENRAELDALIASLKSEIDALPEYGQSSTEPSDIREEGSVKTSVDDLADSVKEFEASHPELTGLVQRLANILSNMGI